MTYSKISLLSVFHHKGFPFHLKIIVRGKKANRFLNDQVKNIIGCEYLRDVIAVTRFGILECSDFTETLLTGHIAQFISIPSSTAH